MIQKCATKMSTSKQQEMVKFNYSLLECLVRAILNNNNIKSKDAFTLYRAVKCYAEYIKLNSDVETKVLKLFLSYDCIVVSEQDYETNLNVFKGFFQRVNDMLAQQTTKTVKILDIVYQYAALIPILFQA